MFALPNAFARSIIRTTIRRSHWGVAEVLHMEELKEKFIELITNADCYEMLEIAYRFAKKVLG